ncbi:hypothetical protein RD792_005279 [Penstemon davidsonii]|uniref:Uncharacterized protein n=1 Tax=Penstemon davidsonii TaxID=160366 RepID=A0ABR0DJQ0_9LAMI|nr:hypothetical protein RD792_005279 [Penstemon davidsonii]
MAETGNPQFVMARSVICVISGVMCLSMALTLIEIYIRRSSLYGYFSITNSDHKWSINWILFIQFCGVALGTIAPVFRWFTAVRFKSSKIDHRRSFTEELKIEIYWTQGLVEWRESSLPLRVRHQKCRKVLHDAKRLLLNICIRIQRLIVLSSKLVLIISAALLYVAVLLFNHIKKRPSNDTGGGLTSSAANTELDFRPYVLLLEGEPEMPKQILTNICIEVDKLIKIGNTQKPNNIVELLNKSENFNGVKEFDNNEVRSLHSQEPRNCWSLSVVTLTSIAVALPNISNHNVDQLLNSVSEDLSFVKLIEKTLDTNGESVSMRSAADVIWVGLELYHKWLDIDIRGTNLKDRTNKQTLQELSEIAEKKVADFKTNTNDLFMKNPVNWPVNVIAANSMYRICQTLLLALHNDCNHQTDEEMFERLSVIISGILVACLTNLSYIIIKKCQSIGIKDRVESVRHAAVLLGESEEILQLLEQRELPNLGPGKAAYIDEWRAFMKEDVENPPISGHQIPHLRPTEYKRSRLSRSRRTVNRPYWGVLSGGAVRERIIRAFLVEEQKIVKKVVKIQKAKEKLAAKA